MSAADNASPTRGRSPVAAGGARPPLVGSLRIENLKALAGEHDIPLAPLTLIYGPNAAGKSTVMQGLRIFMQAVRAGRRDALKPFSECFQKPGGPHLAEMISGHDVECELALGVTLPAPNGATPGKAALGFGLTPDPDVWWQYSEIGLADEAPARKDISFSLGVEAVEPDYAVDGVRVRGDHELFAGSLHDLGDQLFDLASHLVYLGPHRGDPRQDYEPSREFFRRHPGNRDFADPTRVNTMLRHLEIPFAFKVEPPKGPEDGGLRFQRDWQLVDTRTHVDVSLDQVGYGVSQVLPVIEGCIRASEQLVCIEQPELHIHPRLQAKLGQLFAASLLSGNQIIAETHSESLMLRVRKLIRQGTLAAGQVAILYVDNTTDEGVSVRRLRLGDQGELLDPWPTGFFDDSLADILGVTS